MILCQDASFKKPKIKTWRRKYVRLEFSTSIKELEDLAKGLRKEGKAERKFYKIKKEWLNQKWVCNAFMEKCQCEYCKPGWEAYEKATKKIK